jgi:rubrerythrin
MASEAFQTFAQIAKVEKEHEARCLALLKNLQSGRVFKKGALIKWHCRNCGYVHDGKEAPEKCPVCSHPMAFFALLAENY